jgi:hypothetical protein
MSVVARLAPFVAQLRLAQLRRVSAQAEQAQLRLLAYLLRKGRRTAFGRDHDLGQVGDYNEFRQGVPVRDYEALRPWLDRVVAGEADVTWPGRPAYLCKTSGTTSGMKYIPLSREAVPAQVSGARDALLSYIARTGDAAFLDGKLLFLSGSPVLETNAGGLLTGRLSGIAQHFVPSYLQRNRVPTFATNSIEDWESKVAAIVRETRDQDLRLISGIPPWVRTFFDEVTRQTGRTPAEVWPELRLFVTGGVDYSPYREVIEQSLGRAPEVVEAYPASEGFIAMQDGAYGEGLLLLLDTGLFYEFIPLEEYGQADARRLPLWQVQMGQQYALVLTTTSGLWAYDIGDTVRFVSTSPYRIKVTGRVKHFLSAFGEHVIEEEISAALNAAVETSGVRVAESTVAPRVGGDGLANAHEWWVEFDGESNAEQQAKFIFAADESLQARNVYYRDLREGGMLSLPVLRLLRRGAVSNYMASIGKLGGQNKFPRLTNSRALADALAPYEAS